MMYITPLPTYVALLNGLSGDAGEGCRASQQYYKFDITMKVFG